MRYAKATLIEAGDSYEVRVEFFDQNGRLVFKRQEPATPIMIVGWMVSSQVA